jgi:hypothetical protein
MGTCGRQVAHAALAVPVEMLDIENCVADQWSMGDLWGNLIVPMLLAIFKAARGRERFDLLRKGHSTTGLSS